MKQSSVTLTCEIAERMCSDTQIWSSLKMSVTLKLLKNRKMSGYTKTLKEQKKCSLPLNSETKERMLSDSETLKQEKEC